MIWQQVNALYYILVAAKKLRHAFHVFIVGSASRH